MDTTVSVTVSIFIPIFIPERDETLNFTTHLYVHDQNTPENMRGSKHIMVWTTENLVHWSEQRMQKPVDERIGCAWAPKICYDETAWNYAVFFSGGEDGTTILKIFYCRTKDFLSYSEPCVQIEKSRELTEGYILIHPVAAGEKGVGYFPLAATSEQLEAGEFIRLSPAEYSLPEGCKHGSVLLITKAEYERLAVMFP